MQLAVAPGAGDVVPLLGFPRVDFRVGPPPAPIFALAAGERDADPASADRVDVDVTLAAEPAGEDGMPVRVVAGPVRLDPELDRPRGRVEVPVVACKSDAVAEPQFDTGAEPALD